MSNAPLLPVPVPLADLVALQAGAVVSRTLVKTGGGTVTAFAFDTNEALSEHSAPFDALVIGIEGEAEVTSRRSRTGPDGNSCACPRTSRTPEGPTPFKMLLVMVKA